MIGLNKLLQLVQSNTIQGNTWIINVYRVRPFKENFFLPTKSTQLLKGPRGLSKCSRQKNEKHSLQRKHLYNMIQRKMREEHLVAILKIRISVPVV